MRIAIAAAIALLAGAANAADAVLPEPVIEPLAAPAFTWTGGYLGASLGYASADFGVAGLPNPAGGSGFDEGNVGGVLSLDPDGFAGSVSLGYDRQFVGGLVLGVELEAGYLGVEEDVSIYTTPAVAGTVDDDFAAVEMGLYGAATLRAGVAIDRLLLYAEAGAMLADVEATYGDLDGTPAAPLVDLSDQSAFSESLAGYVVGGGVEYAFRDDVSLEFEYNYADLEDVTSTNGDGDTFEADLDLHTVRAGINFRF